MIKLSDSKRQFKTTITHTGNNSGNVYPVTHNLGALDLEVEIWDPSEEIQIATYHAGGASNYGYAVRELDLNSCSITIWLWAAYSASPSAEKTVNVIITAL